MGTWEVGNYPYGVFEGSGAVMRMSKWMTCACALTVSGFCAVPKAEAQAPRTGSSKPEPPSRVTVSPPEPISDQVAFPGALGFGARAMGGRGGRPILVTTLADYGPGEAPIRGSLRTAIEEIREPRIITFAVGGTIELKRSLKLRTPFVTIDGSTAPSPGITLKNWSLGIENAHDVVIRYLRFRSNLPPSPEHGVGGERSLSIGNITGAPTYDIIVDHCTIGHSDDDALSIAGNVYRVTIQWCLFTGETRAPAHGSLVGDEATYDYNEYVTFAYNLYTNFFFRNPTFGGPGRVDFYNNAVIGMIWGLELRPSAGRLGPRINILNNCFIHQRNFPWPSIPNPVIGESFRLERESVYVAGNFYRGWNDDDWELTGELPSASQPLHPSIRRTAAWPSSASPEPALSALAKLYDNAGCTRPARDVLDANYILNAKTGNIVIPMSTTPPSGGGSGGGPEQP